MTDYQTFIGSKTEAIKEAGLQVQQDDLNAKLFGYQKDVVEWALNRGRAAIFADCGMGKTPMQLEWANKIPGRVLIAAPLAVAAQTVREAAKFNIEGAAYLREDDRQTPIVVTNYEMLEKFDPAQFAGVVLDESSILKSYTGKFKQHIIQEWGQVEYRLACTATPAPNDFMELGNHSEFLGVQTGSEMLSSFFINDPGNVGKYRLKGHGEGKFWDWMSQWAVMLKKPSDLGYSDEGFTLPPLNIEEHVVDPNKPPEGLLFALDAHTMQERLTARRSSVEERVKHVAEIVNQDSSAQWLIWCNLNAESEMLNKSIPDSVQVQGSDSLDKKTDRLLGFADGKYRILISKPRIAGFGMNFQGCHNMAFTGLSDSFEQYYQAVRRCWRFGQTKPVNVHVVTARTEGAVVANIRRKEEQAKKLSDSMAGRLNKTHAAKFTQPYQPKNQIKTPSFL